jgi:hypothetical protein
MFKKGNSDLVIADIFAFGTVIRNQVTGSSEFIPAHNLQLETQVAKAMPKAALQDSSAQR